jgi:hypothetical protein
MAENQIYPIYTTTLTETLQHRISTMYVKWFMEYMKNAVVSSCKPGFIVKEYY